MNCTRFVAVLIAVWCLLSPAALPAQGAPPFVMAQQYSTDVVITRNGANLTTHTYLDGDKMRSDTKVVGQSMSTIIRQDTKKLYHLDDVRKTAMEADFDPAQTKPAATVYGPKGKFQLVGPDKVDGVAATKFKITDDDGNAYFFWADVADKIPVEMASEDGSVTVKWKNFKAGPQAPSLFEPPPNYRLVRTPSGAGR